MKVSDIAHLALFAGAAVILSGERLPTAYSDYSHDVVLMSIWNLYDKPLTKIRKASQPFRYS